MSPCSLALVLEVNSSFRNRCLFESVSYHVEAIRKSLNLLSFILMINYGDVPIHLRFNILHGLGSHYACIFCSRAGSIVNNFKIYLR